MGKICPSCGSFLEIRDNRCVNCSADISLRMNLKVFYAIAVAMILIGVFFVYKSKTYKLNITKIEELNKSFSNSLIRIDARFIKTPSYNEKFGSFRTEIADSTGVLSVKAYSNVAKDIGKRDDLRNNQKIEIKGIFVFKDSIKQSYLQLKDANDIVVKK